LAFHDRRDSAVNNLYAISTFASHSQRLDAASK
jgi:hypothetical protein